jgi:hypothetical protein
MGSDHADKDECNFPPTPTAADQECEALKVLRAAIDEGDASGIAADGVFGRLRRRAAEVR